MLGTSYAVFTTMKKIYIRIGSCAMLTFSDYYFQLLFRADVLLSGLDFVLAPIVHQVHGENTLQVTLFTMYFTQY